MGTEAAQQVNKENRYNPEYMRRKRARKINEAMTLYMQEPRSLSDTLIPGDAKSSKYEEVLVDNATESAEARAIRLERYAHLRAVMHAALTPREERILLFRFESDLTLDQVGKRYGLSRERARQIEAEALGKMRRAMRRP